MEWEELMEVEVEEEVEEEVKEEVKEKEEEEVEQPEEFQKQEQQELTVIPLILLFVGRPFGRCDISLLIEETNWDAMC